ncbi:MAG: U32 family peptidase [Verrucomicrobiota bacterium]
MKRTTVQSIHAAQHPGPELMAPAGGLDAGYAAFHGGADAVYLGLKQFSARADAENFTLEELDALTGFAHALEPRRSVYAAVNTLVIQDELADAVALLGSLADIGVDALIVQDLGLYRIVKKYFPELRLFASTQMAVHNRAGAEALKNLGFARVTLARELTLEEIREIVRVLPDIETEVFVHGALCYSYSGLCLFSSLMLGRSGNRGRCAYLCRDNFKAANRPGGFVFSMKDLALPDEISALCEAGVTSFKIEGRKKQPLYVAATAGYYRKLIDGTLSPADRARDEADIKTIFSRPWTRLYLRSAKDREVIDPEAVGHRGTPIGQVEAVFRDRAGTPWVRFTTDRTLERHDGLQIDVPGLPRPFGFPVDNLRAAGRAKKDSAGETFQAPAGSTVEVALPDEYPAIPRDAAVYCSSSQDVKRRYRHARPKPGQYRSRRQMDISLRLTAGELAAEARVVPRHAQEAAADVRCSVAGPFSPAKNLQQVESALRGAFEKLGDTRFALGKFEVLNPDGLFVPVSQANQLRREVTGQLEAKLAANLAERVRRAQAVVCAPLTPDPRPSTAAWSVKVDRVGLLGAFEPADWENLDEVIVEIAVDPLPFLKSRIEEVSAAAGRDRIRLALPLITRSWEEKELQEKIEALRSAGWTKWEAANLSAWTFLALNPTGLPRGSSGSSVANVGAAEQPDSPRGKPVGSALDLSADWSVYVTNRSAALQVLDLGASRFTLSPEDGLANLRLLLSEFGAKATVIAYQDTPLFISESCLLGECSGRARCTFDTLELTSSYGDEVLVVHRECRTVVVGRKPLCLAARLGELTGAGAVSLRADFMYRPYAPAQVRDLWRALRSGKDLPAGHVGNFDRGLL